MEQLVQWVEKHLQAPGMVCCSSSTRTRQTLAPFHAAWPGALDNTSYIDAIYEATSGTLHAIAEEAFDQSDYVLMVGHNPGFENLAKALLQDPDALQISKMSTGTLAVIDFPGGYKKDAGAGLLIHWLTRKNLSAQ
jgi:phosphohistidine phosphatase